MLLLLQVLTCYHYFGRHHDGVNFLVFLKSENRDDAATPALIRSLEESIGSGASLQIHFIEFEYPESILNNPDWESKRNLCAIKYIRGSYDYFFMNQVGLDSSYPRIVNLFF